jgi:hypothetical protein
MSGTPAEPANRDAIIDMIRTLPDGATTGDVMDALFVRRKIELGLQQLDAGEGIPHDVAMKRLDRWMA